MSASTQPDLDLREQIARIDRTLAETQKFFAERDKLAAEARKLSRERVIQVLLAVTGLIGGIITVAQLLLRLRGAA